MSLAPGARYASPESTGEIRALTGLRGAAAVYVVAFHFTTNGQAVGGVLKPLAMHGYLAVDLFFVLSGYVMAMTYGAGFSGPLRRAAFGDFLARRIARVYPMYLVATIACALLAVLDPRQQESLEVGTLLTNLLMIQVWGLSHSLDYPAWSISAEFAAYLSFPLLARAALGSGVGRCRCLALAAVAVLVLVLTRSSAELHEVGSRLGPLDVWSADTPFPVLRCLGGFTLGLCGWRLSSTGALRAIAGQAHAGSLLALSCIALLFMPGLDIAFVLLSAGLVPAIARGASMPVRLLATKPLHWLGTVSYSLYLVHYPVRLALGSACRTTLDWLRVPWPGPLTIIVLFACSLGLAAIAYSWIERPGRVLFRTVLQRHRVGPVAGPAL